MAWKSSRRPERRIVECFINSTCPRAPFALGWPILVPPPTLLIMRFRDTAVPKHRKRKQAAPGEQAPAKKKAAARKAAPAKKKAAARKAAPAKKKEEKKRPAPSKAKKGVDTDGDSSAKHPPTKKAKAAGMKPDNRIPANHR